jgi:formylglycine-generating enzyme required for sulfatase activity
MPIRRCRLLSLIALPAFALAEQPREEHEHTPIAPVATAPEKPVYMTRISVEERDGMVRIPGGRFIMGASDKAAQPNEKPPHEATVGPFWIDKTEVTVGAYRVCVDAHVCERPRSSYATCTFDLGEPELPISCVRWKDAATYCSFVHKRLPREVEWEFAARGTTKAIYPWGNTPGSCAFAATLVRDTSAKTCAPHPTRVGTHTAGASVFHVEDLSGNVEEWVQDWYAPGAASLEPVAGASHVLRGGGWLSAPSMSRTTTRNWGSAMEAGPNVGFRCARSE